MSAGESARGCVQRMHREPCPQRNPLEQSIVQPTQVKTQARHDHPSTDLTGQSLFYLRRPSPFFDSLLRLPGVSAHLTTSGSTVLGSVICTQLSLVSARSKQHALTHRRPRPRDHHMPRTPEREWTPRAPARVWHRSLLAPWLASAEQANEAKQARGGGCGALARGPWRTDKEGYQRDERLLWPVVCAWERRTWKRIKAQAIPERLPPRMMKTSSTCPCISKIYHRGELMSGHSTHLDRAIWLTVEALTSRAVPRASVWFLSGLSCSFLTPHAKLQSGRTCRKSSSELPGGQPPTKSLFSELGSVPLTIDQKGRRRARRGLIACRARWWRWGCATSLTWQSARFQQGFRAEGGDVSGLAANDAIAFTQLRASVAASA